MGCMMSRMKSWVLSPSDDDDQTKNDVDDDNRNPLTKAFQMIRVVNLKECQDRWRAFQDRLQQRVQCQEFMRKVQRFDAVNGKRVLEEYREFEGRERSQETTVGAANHHPLFSTLDLPRPVWDATSNAKYDRHIQPPMRKELSPGEVGCAVSHVLLWRLAVEQLQNPRDCMLILEDDAVLYPAETMDQQHLHHSPKPGQNRSPMMQSQHRSLTLRSPKGEAGTWRRLSQAYSKTFEDCFAQAWKELPCDWDIWYLGFSDRGERKPVYPPKTANSSLPVWQGFLSTCWQWLRQLFGFSNNQECVPLETKKSEGSILSVCLKCRRFFGFADQKKCFPVEAKEVDVENQTPSVSLQWFCPTYGFHTHAYAITKQAAELLLACLPVEGPLDVWLADNQWFDLKVYCCVIQNEGYKGMGAYLATQDRVAAKSSIPQSSHKKKPNTGRRSISPKPINFTPKRGSQATYTPPRNITPQSGAKAAYTPTNYRTPVHETKVADAPYITPKSRTRPAHLSPANLTPVREKKVDPKSFDSSGLKSGTKGAYVPPHRRKQLP